VADIDNTFDVVRFYRALDGARQSQGINWKEVAQAAKVHASTLSRMAAGRRPDANSLALLAAWSGLNPADFVPGFRPAAVNALAQISAFVHADPQLSPEAAIAMDEMIKATYVRLAKRSRGSA
jgi:transcriptional regulator with XRE-family HTH domain